MTAKRKLLVTVKQNCLHKGQVITKLVTVGIVVVEKPRFIVGFNSTLHVLV